MADGPCIVIKNWAKWAPKRRNKGATLPWLKLYRRLLEDRDYRRIEPQYRALLVDLWLLAAECDGKIPLFYSELAWRLRVTEDWLASGLEAIALVGLIELREPPAYKLSTDGTQAVDGMSSERRGEERRGSERIGEDKKQKTGSPAATWLTPFLEAWKAQMGAYPTKPALLGRVLKPLAANGDTPRHLTRWGNFVIGIAKNPQYFGTEARQFQKFAAAPAMYDDPDWWMSPQERREVEKLTEGLR